MDKDYGVVIWTNPDGTKAEIDVDALQTTTEPGNVVMPNLHWDGKELRIIPGVNVLHFGEDGIIYRSIADPKTHTMTHIMCPGPYPCAGPHPHPEPQPIGG